MACAALQIKVFISKRAPCSAEKNVARDRKIFSLWPVDEIPLETTQTTRLIGTAYSDLDRTVNCHYACAFCFRVKIDVIADTAGDRGTLIAFDSNNNVLGLIDSPVMAAGTVQTLSFTAPPGTLIKKIQAAGNFVTGSVALDNLQYVIDPLKTEIVIGNALVVGNFYAGAVHGLKVQQGTNLPAPNIPINLINAWGMVVQSTTTNAAGEYWFLDVVPGMYTVFEPMTPSIITLAPPVPITVPHAGAVFSTDIPVGNQMYYLGLQTPSTKNSLTLVNLIKGSIHGTVKSQTGAPVANYPIQLFGPTSLATVTNAQGVFHFENLIPGGYVLIANGTPIVVTVSSGEEEVGLAGLSQLDPGQYESAPNPSLNIIVPVADNQSPVVTSVRVGSTSWTPAFNQFVDPVSKLGFIVPTGSAAQLDSLPWINIDRMFLTFSEDVGASLQLSDFSIMGTPGFRANATQPAIPTITSIMLINPTTVQLNLSSTIDASWIDLRILSSGVTDPAGNILDGNWTNGGANTQSGNGTVLDTAPVSGIVPNNFSFRMAVLPGDGSPIQNKVVNSTDSAFVIGKQNEFFIPGLLPGNAASPGYNPKADLDGSAIINSADQFQVLIRQNSFLLPPPAPNLSAALGTTADGTVQTTSVSLSTSIVVDSKSQVCDAEFIVQTVDMSNNLELAFDNGLLIEPMTPVMAPLSSSMSVSGTLQSAEVQKDLSEQKVDSNLAAFDRVLGDGSMFEDLADGIGLELSAIQTTSVRKSKLQSDTEDVMSLWSNELGQDLF